MKKLALILALAMIATVSFAGCGGSSSSDTGSDTSESAVVDENSEESAADDENAADADASTAALSGTYSAATITVDGTEQDYSTYCAEQAAAQGLSEGDEGYDTAIAALQISYVFAEDGTVTATMAGTETAGTYTYDGDSTVSVTFNGQESALTYDSSTDTLSSTDENTGTAMTFTAAE